MDDRLNIIENKDSVWYKQNLLDTKTGKILFKTWALTVTRVYLGKDKEPKVYYLVRFYDPKTYANRHLLLNANGKNALKLGKEPNHIAVWDDGRFSGTGPVLRVTLPDEGGDERLVSLSGKILTNAYEQFDAYSSCNKGLIKIFRNCKRKGSKQHTYLTYPGFKRITGEWFDGESYDDLWKEKRSEPDFAAVVKYNGRWRVLRTDGSLDPLQKKQ